MPDQDMFEDQNQQQQKQEETPPQSQSNPFDDKLKEIVNDKGEPKYRDIETALSALKESQQFIETLKQEKSQTSAELEEARVELERMGNIDDFVKKLNPPATTKETEETPSKTDSLSEEKVEQLLQKHLQQRDTQSQQRKNLEEVTRKLSDVHGDKSAEFIKQRAKELGTTAADLKQLAMTNPRLAMAALETKAKNNAEPSRSQMSSTYTPTDDNPLPTWERGAASGGLTDRELGDRFRQAREYTHKRLGVEK